MLITAGGSCWKVMFSQASVISSVQGGGLQHPYGVCPEGGLHPEEGVCIKGGLHSGCGQRAGSTHPTGMHSCFQYNI